MESNGQIVIYGTRWCGDTIRARRFFEKHTIDYKWVDIDEDPEAARFVQSVNNGFKSVPTIIFPDGSRLVEPSTSELSEKLLKQ